MRKGPKVLKASTGSNGTSAVKRSKYAKGCWSVTLKTSGLAKIPLPNLIKAKSQRATGFQRHGNFGRKYISTGKDELKREVPPLFSG